MLLNLTLTFVLRASTLVLAASMCTASLAANAKDQPAAKKTSQTATKAQTLGPSYAERADAMALANEIAQRRGLDSAWVQHHIGQARFSASVARAIAAPAVGTPKNWNLYRSRFIEPIRIQAGVRFWQANRESLERAEAVTGVPPAIVVGIVGVESIYGRHTGTHRVMDALTTLALDFPTAHPRAAARTAFFKAELEAFLVLAHRTQTDPQALRGSYAGALGMPQFMPSSWTQYAIDFDSDGRVDLFHSPADVIGSVANYLKAFHWQAGMPTHYPVEFHPPQLDLPTLLEPDIRPTWTPAEMVAKGATPLGVGLQHAGKLALVELQNGAQAPDYVAGTDNFYAITRYNWSSYYAMAVITLGQEVAQAMQK
jgi:membrane-bound lytic murein transglycosylase B